MLTVAGMPDPHGRVTRSTRCMAAARAGPGRPVRGQRGRALPGAAQAIAALAASPAAAGVRMVQSLLTGNVRALAEVKLRPARPDRATSTWTRAPTAARTRDPGGAGADRPAQRGPGATAQDFGGAATVLVGDTPLDVEAALATGARAVGVATGGFTLGELAASGAHAVLPDLADTAAVLAAILGETRRSADRPARPSRG